jgi:hypothetical protein
MADHIQDGNHLSLDRLVQLMAQKLIQRSSVHLQYLMSLVLNQQFVVVLLSGGTLFGLFH